VDRVVADYFVARDALEPVSRTELVERAARGEVVILDVRPAEEFVAGHIPGALSVPLDQLDAALSRLPRGAPIVAYCRGPYCVLAPQAVQRLRAKGYTARRLVDGMPEWRLAGLPIAVGEK
jgi:ArsR family transcriptional regulator